MAHHGVPESNRWGLMVPGRAPTPSEGHAQSYTRVGDTTNQRIRVFLNGTTLQFGPDDIVDEFEPNYHPFGDQVALIDQQVRDIQAHRGSHGGDDNENGHAFNNFRSRVLDAGNLQVVTFGTDTYRRAPSRFARTGGHVSMYNPHVYGSVENLRNRRGAGQSPSVDVDTRYGVTIIPGRVTDPAGQEVNIEGYNGARSMLGVATRPRRLDNFPGLGPVHLLNDNRGRGHVPGGYIRRGSTRGGDPFRGSIVGNFYRRNAPHEGLNRGGYRGSRGEFSAREGGYQHLQDQQVGFRGGRGGFRGGYHERFGGEREQFGDRQEDFHHHQRGPIGPYGTRRWDYFGRRPQDGLVRGINGYEGSGGRRRRVTCGQFLGDLQILSEAEHAAGNGDTPFNPRGYFEPRLRNRWEFQEAQILPSQSCGIGYPQQAPPQTPRTVIWNRKLIADDGRPIREEVEDAFPVESTLQTAPASPSGSPSTVRSRPTQPRTTRGRRRRASSVDGGVFLDGCDECVLRWQ